MVAVALLSLKNPVTNILRYWMSLVGFTVSAGYAQKDFAVKHPPPLSMECIDCKEAHLTPVFKISYGRRLH